MRGVLVLVVGPSGSGKDTLLAGAAQALGGDGRLRFVRRVVTRAVAEEEDHEVADAESFAARQTAGGFALFWEAHGLHYGIPADIAADLAGGRVVVANVSRGILAETAMRFPVAVVEVTAPAALRAARLRRRGREGAEDIMARLTRDGPPLPQGLPTFTIVNDGSVKQGIAMMADFLLRMTETEPQPEHAATGGTSTS